MISKKNLKYPKISNTFVKTLVLPIICDKCDSKDEKKKNQLICQKLLVQLKI